MSLHEKTGAPHGLLAALIVAAVLVEGYHPYSEDGGVYVAGVKRLLDPGLYPKYTEFVTEHIRFSLFAPMLAGMVRISHVGLPVVLFCVYVASMWLLLYAAWQLAARCFPGAWERAGAVALTALWCGLPVAGTSLMTTDPYVTARSLTTPLMLLAVAAAMNWRASRRSRWICVALLAAAACLHPLMAAYATGFVALIVVVQQERRAVRVWGLTVLGIAAMLLAAVLQGTAAADSPAYTAVALSRYYWFPWWWHSYELLGLAGPLVVIALAGRKMVLGRAAIAMGLIAAGVALAFARVHMATHIVARLQPLRCFQIVYLVMMVLLGARMGAMLSRWMRGRWIAAAVLFAGLAVGMFAAQRQSYPASVHLELPGRAAQNDWVRAFAWVRGNTPVNSLFALDANYITTGGEDAQCFRAIAERSALPDYSKDGGEASITPGLTAAWILGSTAQDGLSADSDAQRKAKLLPLEVDWVVLKRAAVTGLDCPYANETVKVCRMR